MEISYFLGANSRDGFASLYSGFAAGEGDRLHIIKGGPGTGKSGFMKKLGAAAERRGLDVEYVLCSGDPDSLDGVYIPALKQGWDVHAGAEAGLGGRHGPPCGRATLLRGGFRLC